MPFMLFTIFAALLLLFTGMAGAECNGKDKSWSDLGDGNAIEAAIKDACSRMAGDYENGSMVSEDDPGVQPELPTNHGTYTVNQLTMEQVDGCANVGENHIEARIEIKTKPENGKSDVTLVEGVCHILLDGVSSDFQNGVARG